MNQKIESISKKGKLVALAGIASLAISCASAPKADQAQAAAPVAQKTEQMQNVKPVLAVASVGDVTNPVFLQGKSLDDYFRDFNQLNSEQQITLAKTLNNLPLWDTVLLARYAPIDATLKDLSSFYSTDYKGFLETLLLRSNLNPTAAGLSNDKGLGLIGQVGEEWARRLYNNKRLAYRFSGQEINDNIFDPNTNLVLSSILFRKASEEKVSDLDAVFGIYNHGYAGVKTARDGPIPTKDNPYVASDLGMGTAGKTRAFSTIADELMVFSWVSMNNLDLKKYIDEPNLRKALEENSGVYEGRTAYEGMINYLNSIATNSRKYTEDNKKLLVGEAGNIGNWIKKMYGAK